jgi:hypothetical protein
VSASSSRTSVAVFTIRESLAERVHRPLLDGLDAELLAGHVPVANRERHCRVDHEIHSVPEVGGNARGRLAALLHVNAGDRQAPDAKREELRLECRAGECVSCVLEQDGLAGIHADEIHETEVRAVALEARVAVGVQKEEDRKPGRAMCVDQRGNVALEASVVAVLPLGIDLEGVLRVDDEQGGLGERDLIYGQHFDGLGLNGAPRCHIRPPSGGYCHGQVSVKSGHWYSVPYPILPPRRCRAPTSRARRPSSCSKREWPQYGAPVMPRKKGIMRHAKPDRMLQRLDSRHLRLQ